MALTSRGKVYSWGNGQGGRLGHGNQTGKSTPVIIEELRDEEVIMIESGDAHSGCITGKGKVYVWGVGLNGRLGICFDTN